MKYELINYDGVDDIDSSKYDYVHSYKKEGSISIDFSVKNILSFHFHKECINYKIIPSFEGINFEDKEIFSKLIVVNNKFELSFEYGYEEDFSKLSILNETVFDSIFISLEDFDYSNLNIDILTKDLYCNLICENEIFYSVYLMICINNR